MLEIRFLPDEKRVRVAPGTMLSQAITKANLAFEFPCGGQGKCGKCKVRILSNCPTPTHADSSVLSKNEIAQGYRLACQTRVFQPMDIEVDHLSIATRETQILTDENGNPENLFDAEDIRPVSLHPVNLPEPTLEDDRPDLVRLQDAVGACTFDLELLRTLPSKLRRTNFRGTAVIVHHHLVDFLPPDDDNACLGLAFDIGTTTLVGSLIDLVTGKPLATTSRVNPQTRFGDDVISRIQRVREAENGLEELHNTVIDAVNEMITELCKIASVSCEKIYFCAFSGNTTMLHLVTAVTPAALGELPFVPAVRHSLIFPASKLGLQIHPFARALTLPIIGGFVGGDTVAGILVTDLAETDGPVMLIDIGTNGEIALKSGDDLCAASCAAGPAFEGATISHGMRAAQGAIEEIVLSEQVQFKTIGGVPPIGLCGSALIDLVAELLQHEILTSDGTLLSNDNLPKDLPEDIRKRITVHDSGPEFVVATAEESGTGYPISLTHRDIRALQLATAAIRAGIEVLLAKNGLKPSELKELLVAGAFGNYIRPRNAQRMGLLPHTLDPERIRFIGNSSLAGAKAVLLSQRALLQADAIAKMCKHVELSRDPNFVSAYVENMFFPSDDIT